MKIILGGLEIFATSQRVLLNTRFIQVYSISRPYGKMYVRNYVRATRPKFHPYCVGIWRIKSLKA